MTIENNFRTNDLYFAAFLKASDVEFIEAARVGGKVYFVFDTEEVDVRSMRNGFYSGNAEVSALDLTNALKNFKSLCHNV